MLSLIFVIIALVLALVSAFNVPSRIGLFALAFASYMVSILVTRV